MGRHGSSRLPHAPRSRGRLLVPYRGLESAMGELTLPGQGQLTHRVLDPREPVTEVLSSCRTLVLPGGTLASRASRGMRAACPGRHETPGTHLGRSECP